MARFEIETPQGRFEVEAPDQETAIRALSGQQEQPQPQPPMGDAAKEFAQFASQATQNPAAGQYEMLPEWQKPLVAGNDILQTFANGATFGFGDKAVAGARSMFTGKSYEDELAAARSKTQGARNRSGWAGTVGEVAGSVAAPLAAAGKGVTLAGRLGTGAMTGAKGLAARTGLMAAEGSGYGALGAAGNDQDITTGAGIGALAGGAGNVIGEGLAAGVGKVAGMFNKRPPTISADELRAASKQAYGRAEDAGVVFNKESVSGLQKSIVDDLTEFGYHPRNEPGVRAIVSELNRLSQGNVTLKGLDTLRKMAGNGFVPGNNSNNALLSKIIGRIDEMATKAGPESVIMGDATAGSGALKEARSLWGRARKLDTVEELLGRAELNAGSSGSGGNVENASRQQLKRILVNPKMRRGFTADEQEALRKAVLGSKTQNALRLAGKLSPQGNGLMLAIGGAGSIAAPTIAIPAMVAGYGAKKTAEMLSRRSVRDLVNLISQGGDASTMAVVKNAVQLLSESKRQGLARAMMALGVGAGTLSQTPVQ